VREKSRIAEQGDAAQLRAGGSEHDDREGVVREITYAVISGNAELTDDPGGSFHQVMYDLHMGGAVPPPEPGAERLIARLRPQHTYAPPSYAGGPE
jgi:hypothetical protein